VDHPPDLARRGMVSGPSSCDDLGDASHTYQEAMGRSPSEVGITIDKGAAWGQREGKTPLLTRRPPIPAAPSHRTRLSECPAGRGSWSWCGDHVLLLAAVVFFVGVAFVFMANLERSEWQVCFVRAALRMQAGRKIHVVENFAYAYPPAMAMLAVPLANLPARAGMFGWYLVNVVATMVAFVSAWRLTGGPSLVRLSPGWQAVFWLGMVLSFRFFVAPLAHQQFDMVIAALLLAGCCRIWRGRDMSGAALIGAAAAMKCTPLLLAPYLAWRGKLRAAGLVVTIAVGLNLLPDLLWPQTSGRLYLADWAASFLGVVAREVPGTWHADPLQNQSLSALFGRIVQFGWPLSPVDPTALAWGSGAADQGPAANIQHSALPLQLAVYGTELLLVGVTVWFLGSPRRPAPTVPRRTGNPVPLGRLQTGAEVGAAVCLMLLLSPMSSKSHYVVLLLPSLLIARAVVHQSNRWLRRLLIPLLVCGPLSTKGLLGKPLGDLTLMWGLPTWYALCSLVCIWIVLAAVRAETGSRVDRSAVAV
jgi:hypothetical protein